MNINIKRRAYIIGAQQVYGQIPLVGVQIDKERVKNFLLSDTGGAWNEDEINCFEKPIFYIPQTQSNKPIPDFELIYFSGHGYTTKGKTYVRVNDTQTIRLSKFHCQVKKRLIIIDACRNIIKESSFFEKTAETTNIGAESNRSICRNIYDRAILDAKQGTTILFASSLGQSAIDTKRGGVFTTHLIDAANDWAKQKETNRYHVLTVNGALELAQDSIASSRIEQNPEMLSNQQPQFLPFAVR